MSQLKVLPRSGEKSTLGTRQNHTAELILFVFLRHGGGALVLSEAEHLHVHFLLLAVQASESN